MLGLFEKKNKVDNKDVCASKGEMKKGKTAEDDVVLEISEEVLREISGGRGANPLCDVREGISAANANQGYAAGEMNDIDGWD